MLRTGPSLAFGSVRRDNFARVAVVCLRRLEPIVHVGRVEGGAAPSLRSPPGYLDSLEFFWMRIGANRKRKLRRAARAQCCNGRDG